MVSSPMRIATNRFGVLWFLFVFALALAAVPPVPGQTMLTNAQPVFITLPPVERVGDLVTGEDAFTIFVPPGAEELTVRFDTVSQAPLELALRHEQPIGFAIDAGFRQRINNRGFAEITVTPKTHPRIQPGLWFIAWIVTEPDTFFDGRLAATVEGPAINPLVSVAESNFRNGDEGWTLNDTPSPLPGTTLAPSGAQLEREPEGGNPDGFLKMTSPAGLEPTFYVAPEKFLVNIAELNQPQFQMDLLKIAGVTEVDFVTEIRVFGANGAFRWRGPSPPQIPDGWVTVQAAVTKEDWFRFAGEQTFEEVFGDPQRIEVRGHFITLGNTVGLDNFRLVSRDLVPPRPVLPTVTSFSGGIDGWRRNYPGEEDLAGATTGNRRSALVWNQLQGNPGGFAQLAEVCGDGADAFVAPGLFLGDMTGLSSPRFEFDYMHVSGDGAERPVTVRIIGPSGAYEWTGAVPGSLWGRQVAPLEAGAWQPVAGGASFEEVLAGVSRIEVSADQGGCNERNGLDNFSLLTDDSPPVFQMLTANPSVLNFSAAASAESPQPQTIDITSQGGMLQWEIRAEGELAERITLSQASGTTPAEVSVSVDTAGLAAGEFEASLVIELLGATIVPVTVPVTLTVSGQPFPTPVIDAVVQSASFEPRFAPGALATIFGRNLGGPESGLQTSFTSRTGDRLPTEAAGVRVLILDRFGNLAGEAPLLYLDNRQVNFQIPFEAGGLGEVRIVVAHGSVESEPFAIRVDEAAPGIFTFGGNRAVAVNQDGTLNTSDNPAAREEVLAVYLTGQGRVAPEWPSGRAAPFNPLVRAPQQARVTIGGVDSQIMFLGLAPGLVGVLQLNVRPLFEAPAGDRTLRVTIGGRSSNGATVSIR